MAIIGECVEGTAGAHAEAVNAEASGKLRRVDTGKYEAPTIGVEYHSPAHFGSIYGDIYRQYFGSTLPADLTSGNNVSDLMGFWLEAHDTVNRYVVSGWSNDGSSALYIVLSGISGAGNLIIASSGAFVDRIIEGWVDYVKA